jgi:hypothetical protein
MTHDEAKDALYAALDVALSIGPHIEPEVDIILEGILALIEGREPRCTDINDYLDMPKEKMQAMMKDIYAVWMRRK